ncbi:bifunctional 3'-5' exonuclease/DNA polymerase [Micrococcus flavus]|uniref:DNA-directed DNA polymerase n=2 Tax=Micrococcus flavus TaxID=384602 RepID=A0A4Y8WX19_9MICC|nr:bifunctional 3'-5' exonuclease/DNA polymerase [Micrococcus flavus]MBB4882300.1 DNA polymerase-1 [Micrococcus flavus]TFH99915.1 bifunctional 3'-5' exonuclease/DNA polymerase [Micrococcus flavus]GGK49796.1 bifunctional 3'-5' exonuclease/DNA polymerase [Micrococcus flavus]
MHIVLGPAPDAGSGTWCAVPAEPDAPAGLPEVPTPVTFPREAASDVVRDLPRRLGTEARAVRWVLASVAEEYPRWLRAGVPVDAVRDLSLGQRILTRAAAAGAVEYRPAVELAVHEPEGDAPAGEAAPALQQGTMFELPAPAAQAAPDVRRLAAELAAQHRAVASSAHPARLRLLLAAESQGALVAAEIHRAGLPWRADLHDARLTERLGPRPAEGERPARLQALAEQVADDLGAPGLNPDSQKDLLRALQTAGVTVDSTRQHELQSWAARGGAEAEARTARIAALLEYKALYRLWTANGWHWLDTWVRDGRFHAAYLVGGVVTGRWAAHGGGAMQVPAVVRDAVRADDGHLLTVADASQVEPRILAAMAQDAALAAAGSTPDLYREVAEQGRSAGTALDDRSRAKVALLGAMYGATTGDSAALLPHLRRLYPNALGLLEQAAAAGEAGRPVSTWLGRWSPPADEGWLSAVADRSTRQAESRAGTLRRSAGRFTRNYVVQGTAAEWALCWMGEIRRRLRTAGARTQLVFFVHDEVVLHGPAEEAEAVAGVVREAAAEAGRLLFGAAPVDFPLTVSQTESYADAK